jgi:uncharacterized protein YjbJ (UPF0337 family)
LRLLPPGGEAAYIGSQSSIAVGSSEQIHLQGVASLKASFRWSKQMDWNRVEGNWKQVKGKVKEKWGQLTDDDLNMIEGRRDQLEGKIQQRYGLAKDQVRRDVDDWYASQHW